MCNSRSILVNIHFSNYQWFISLPLEIELISDTNAQLIQNSITSYHKNQGRTREKNEKGKKGNNQSHD